ncbi:hypothetical protein AvCA_33800 [Azotobacter vinelandii CA]|uniref:Uncharacterized protein n=2 Tax=Azotobacter vinelandii TaxID=354 RepID=C1DPV9_AZOVD|nr:hypothetical protein Avin_33800 [Azotobacter vinelandii DJ]AGK14650.1 hypothetical protein AvCA_33800 [Azotobacter vinelandii CA]AGK21300.1 hypothetical protein AvCA6_33800 [Azotobacter vinelandii CA6]
MSPDDGASVHVSDFWIAAQLLACRQCRAAKARSTRCAASLPFQDGEEGESALAGRIRQESAPCRPLWAAGVCDRPVPGRDNHGGAVITVSGDAR